MHQNLINTPVEFEKSTEKKPKEVIEEKPEEVIEEKSKEVKK